jgi:CHASE2 domain-containing sensor protein
MTKRVVLRFDGALEQGFEVTLEIGKEGTPFFLEAVGSLPPAPELVAGLARWQHVYRQISDSTRINLKQITVRMGPLYQLEDCRQAARELQQQLKMWLESPSFHAIDRQLRESLSIHEPVQVLLRSRDRRLHSLPWHLWDFFERYSLAELALSTAPGPIHPDQSTATATVKALAILGDRRGIDIEVDRQFLNHLPHAEVEFLVEPSRQQITNHLWDQAWDILFFAGHSQTEGNQGRIHINPEDSLTIEELKYGLRTAIARGLQLAIFNSCDGLGLAYELEQLHLPHLIVMRQPVPDQVAQAFLKHFLTAFAQGELLYQAIRVARERLQGLEGQYPCASWLPILYQNPAAVPPSWQSLQGDRSAEKQPQTIPFENTPRWHSQSAGLTKLKTQNIPYGNASRTKFKIQNDSSPLPILRRLLLISLASAGFIFGVRHFGMLQSLELAAFDHLLQLRPSEPPDPRLLVVLVTDADVQAQPHAQRRGSLSDSTLAQLLQKLEADRAKVIGLDIYRDFPADQNAPQLVNYLRQNDRLVSVCKVGDVEKQTDGVAPPPEVPATQTAFSDIVFDADNVVRRQLLAMTPPPSSRCVAPYALSVQLALRYLDGHGISLQYPDPDTWQLGKLRFQPLKAPIGGYRTVDDRGHQILLNYRSLRSLERGVRQVTLGQVLAGQVQPDAIKDRIVLIGTIAEGTHDYWLTPCRTAQGNKQAIPGVILQAQMTSQLLSAVLDQRPLLWAWAVWLEAIWIWGWAALGGLLAWTIRKPTYLGLALIGAIAAVFSSCLLLLMQTGAWVPLVPVTIALITSGIGVKAVEASSGRRNEP